VRASSFTARFSGATQRVSALELHLSRELFFDVSGMTGEPAGEQSNESRESSNVALALTRGCDISQTELLALSSSERLTRSRELSARRDRTDA